MRVLAQATLLVALAAVPLLADELERYNGPLISFAHPRALTATSTSDVSADVAVSLTGSGALSATVLAAERRSSESEAQALAEKWHAARVKNRAAWGMRTDGGPPAESVRVGERRCQRFRDRIGSVLGASEQTMLCASVSAHLVCAVVSAPAVERERADKLAALLMGSVSIKR